MDKKDKALDIISEYISMNLDHGKETDELHGNSYEYHKKCALILVDEVKSVLVDLCCEFGGNDKIEEYIDFFCGVKREIENM
jgi:hypothetical protein